MFIFSILSKPALSASNIVYEVGALKNLGIIKNLVCLGVENEGYKSICQTALSRTLDVSRVPFAVGWSVAVLASL